MVQERDKDGQVRPTLGKGDMSNDAWGTPRVSIDFSIFHGMFTFDIPDKMWLLSENGVELISTENQVNGTSSVNGELVISSGANSSWLMSKRHPRYQPNRGHRYSTSIFLPSPNALGIRKWGLFTDTDGAYFKLENGILYACVMSLGVEYYKRKIEAGFDFNLANGNTYDIQFQWRGVGDFFFYVGNPKTKQLTKVHETDFYGTNSSISISNPALPIGYECINGGDIVTIKSGCVDVTSEGGNIEREQFVSAISNDVIVGQTGDVILAIKIPSTFKGLMNTRDCRLLRVSASSDKKSRVRAYITRDITALTITTGTWVPINGGNIEVYTPVLASDSSLDDAKAKAIVSLSIEAGTNVEYDNPSTETIDFFITHGDYLIIEGYGNTATMSASIALGEEI